MGVDFKAYIIGDREYFVWDKKKRTLPSRKAFWIFGMWTWMPPELCSIRCGKISGRYTGTARDSATSLRCWRVPCIPLAAIRRSSVRSLRDKIAFGTRTAVPFFTDDAAERSSHGSAATGFPSGQVSGASAYGTVPLDIFGHRSLVFADALPDGLERHSAVQAALSFLKLFRGQMLVFLANFHALVHGGTYSGNLLEK
ncbi:MAG: hypothetical protein FWC27_13500 [Firmicutes bacterium]|nr:hypothetical protein [Bacillota bacterium]